MKRIVIIVMALVAVLVLTGLSNPVKNLVTYQVTCLTTATPLRGAKGALSALTVWNGTATAAFIGGSDVNATTAGMPICTTASCYDSKFPVDGGDGYCMSVGGAVVLTITAGR